MVGAISTDEVTSLFDEFVRAFETFDGKVVGKLFVAPGVALRRDGSLQGFAVQSDIEAYYQTALDHYRGLGCRGCRYDDLEIQAIGTEGVMGTVSWDLLHGDGSVITHWRQAYMMARFESELRIYASAFVAD